MNLQEIFQEFLQKTAETLEEYQIQCQSMAFETDFMPDYVDRPTFRLKSRVQEHANLLSRQKTVQPVIQKKDMSEVIYTADTLATMDSSALDRIFIQRAAKTKKPRGPCFMKKMRRMFPSMTRNEIAVRIARLIDDGKIIDEEARVTDTVPRQIGIPIPSTGSTDVTIDLDINNVPSTTDNDGLP